MLEHADRDDPVEAAGGVAVILKFEFRTLSGTPAVAARLRESASCSSDKVMPRT